MATVKDIGNKSYEFEDSKRLKVIVGGSDPSKFAPSANFSYHFESGSEKRFLNICDDPDQLDTTGAIESKESDKVSVKVGEVETSFELIGDHLKINRIFDTKPKEAPRYRVVQSGDIDWFYQDELTPDEIADGCYRPDEVVGSYAIYFRDSGKTKNANGSTKVNYSTGKLCHLYAPYWKDANGDTVKGGQEYKDGWLIFALPSDEWLNKAVYPITLDPDIGKTDIGGSSYDPDSRGRALGPYRPGSDATLDSISVYLATFGGTPWASDRTLRTALYSKDGDPDERLTYHSLTSGMTTNAWNETDHSGDAQAITGGNDYYVGIAADTGDGYWKYDTAYYSFYKNSAYLPNPWTGTAYNNYKFSAYFTYSVGGGTIEGSTCWGHSTGVEEDNTRTFAGKWTGGTVSGSGDNEILTLNDDGSSISEAVNTGATTVTIEIDKYGG